MACQHSQQARDVDPMLVQSWPTVCEARWPSIKTALVFAGLHSIAAGPVVLTADSDYKLSPTQCLLNVGPASPALGSIHPALVSTSCWQERVYIQRSALLQTAKWENLLISQVCLYRLLEGL